MADPLYYRFILNPQDGEVELAHNYEADPAHVRYHSDLADQMGQGYHGYAYRIRGGWRLTDWDHKPIEDPYVIAQVIRAIRQEEGPYLEHEGPNWEDVHEPSFDKWHYGLPVG